MSAKKMNVKNDQGKRSVIVLFLSIIAVVSVLTTAYSLYEMKNVAQTLAANKKTENKTLNEETTRPVYLPLDTFTVSLPPAQGEEERVLYIGITLRLKDTGSQTLIEQYLPEVRSRLLVAFSQQNARELSTDEGKSKLVKRIKEEVGKPFGHQQANVTDVLFNAFILR